ncbi:MAG: AAA family ATPase [Bacteroidales bacterium]|nr:AAA family ATPase [Bacteroidales bacterium]
MDIDCTKVSIKNCRNIKKGEVIIRKNKLNVKYGLNGTGKSTLANALEYYFNGDSNKLKEMKSFGEESIPELIVTVLEEGTEDSFNKPFFKKAISFNEDFVSNTIFNKNEAIDNSFDVFISNPIFEENRKKLDERLKGLKVDIASNSEFQEMKTSFFEIAEKLKFNKDGKLSKTGFGKGLASKNTTYNVPEVLKGFNDFFSSDKVVTWVDWKSKGKDFDDKDNCPFCASHWDKEDYDKTKKVFETTYDKTMIQNKKQLEDAILKLKKFMSEPEYELFEGFTKKIDDEDSFSYNISRLQVQYNEIIRKITEIIEFDAIEFKTVDGNIIEEKLNKLKIKDKFDIFSGEATDKVFNIVNGKIEVLLNSIKSLNNEINELNNTITESISLAKEDINDFLRSAGVNYYFEIEQIAEKSSISRLKYIKSEEELYESNDIRKSLSWGEKNVVALILFLYYSKQQGADLIILDDPISSFDKNKKFAIMSRLFSPFTSNSFKNNTVLFLTHDLEPIIDLKTKHYFENSWAFGSYLANNDEELLEKEIDVEKHIISTIALYHSEATDNIKGINTIVKMVALRKYLEYNDADFEDNVSYDMLSSLMKKRDKPTKSDGRTILIDDEVNNANIFIRKYFSDFDYEIYLNNYFNKDYIKELYDNEENTYNKVQLFRQYLLLSGKKTRKQINPVLQKYANESFHIENDYTHCLNYYEFDIVPHYVIKGIDDFMIKQ